MPCFGLQDNPRHALQLLERKVRGLVWLYISPRKGSLRRLILATPLAIVQLSSGYLPDTAWYAWKVTVLVGVYSIGWHWRLHLLESHSRVVIELDAT